MSSIHFSSMKSDWETPPEVFQRINQKYGPCTWDVCATPANAKCPEFFTPEIDGLSRVWSGVCWMNPPYGREIGRWVEKAAFAYQADRVICLLPARTDTAWWHNHVIPYGKVEFLKGRIKFVGAKHAAPFPSAVVIFDFDNRR